MSETPKNQFIGRHLHERSLRTRIILSQLPLFLTMTLAAALIAVLNPEFLRETTLIAGCTLNALLLLACIVVPWNKIPPVASLVIPYVGFIAVVLFRDGAQEFLSSTGILALFPIFWICSSGFAPRTAVIISTLVSWVIVWIPVFQSDVPLSVDTLVKPLLFPFMMLAFSIASVVLTTSMDDHRTQLESKDRLLRAALEQSQHSERLMETILDTVGVGVVVVDGHGNDRLVNSTQMALHEFGKPSGVAIPQEGDLLLFNANREPLPPEARPVQRAISGESFTNYQIWIGAGERARGLSTTARVILDEDGARDGAVIAYHDVTEMFNAITAKDDFLANVSHEFRTPLTAIQSYLELALETPGLHPGHVRKYLSIADRNAERLSGLVTDLLSTTSITVRRKQSDVARLLADSIATASPAAAVNAVVLDCQSEEPLFAMIDPVRIGQVLDNLLSNAVKYSPDGGTLTVRAWAEGTDLHCSVQDTGLGMSATEQAGVFQKFFRAGTAVDLGIPGIGLGLMICKTIIESHDGTLNLESQHGVGTTMSFVIPACVRPSNSQLTVTTYSTPAEV
ncbi:ATP-binding protein [Arthrobacter sp. TMP15]|uniref:sensor histidine kinase n=1 Tax=Arthrobacter sp. TMP15 TaxID=3140789 RepID=UPI0031BB8CAF